MSNPEMNVILEGLHTNEGILEDELTKNGFRQMNIGGGILIYVGDYWTYDPKYGRIIAKGILDDNPEHIHLFSNEDLKSLFLNNGCSKVKIMSVTNHTVMVAYLN